mgnify:CR=1 FL=1
MKTWKIITTLVVAVLVLIVVLQNTAAMETQILFFTLTLPRALRLFLTFLVGFILGMVVKLSGKRRT